MHKGYAFVQFTNPFDARNACHGEDGRTILSQVLGKYIVFSISLSLSPHFIFVTLKNVSSVTSFR